MDWEPGRRVSAREAALDHLTHRAPRCPAGTVRCRPPCAASHGGAPQSGLLHPLTPSGDPARRAGARPARRPPGGPTPASPSQVPAPSLALRGRAGGREPRPAGWPSPPQREAGTRAHTPRRLHLVTPPRRHLAARSGIRLTLPARATGAAGLSCGGPSPTPGRRAPGPGPRPSLAAVERGVRSPRGLPPPAGVSGPSAPGPCPVRVLPR